MQQQKHQLPVQLFQEPVVAILVRVATWRNTQGKLKNISTRTDSSSWLTLITFADGVWMGVRRNRGRSVQEMSLMRSSLGSTT